MLDETMATAETSAVYRGVELKITVNKYSSGSLKVIVVPKRVSTALRPELADRDANEEISTSKSSFEATSANLALDKNEFLSIKTVTQGRQTIFDMLLRRGPPSVSSVVARSLDKAETAIDNYIEKRQTLSIDASEVEHGIDQAIMQQQSSVKTNNPSVRQSEEVGNKSICVSTGSEELAEKVERERS